MTRPTTITTVLAILALCSSALAMDGSGTEIDPYIITNVDELQAMRDDLGAHYQLGNDIDATGTVSWFEGAGFEPVGSAVTPFTGALDGRDHTITGLYINRPSASGVGLFGRTWRTEIENVGLVDAQVYGYYNVATLVGSNQGRSTITSCYATGEVIISASGSKDTKSGGLVGGNGTSLISQCYSAVNVTALSSRYQVGGLCGYSRARSGDPPALIENCYSTGTVTSNGYKIGGLLGDADGENSTVSKCYSVGRVNGPSRKGLVGYNWRSPTIKDSYWDTQTSTCSSSYGGAPRSTAQMMQQATFVNWDFYEVWDIIENQTYPFFAEPPLLVALEIAGPDEVAENHQTRYHAIALYDNNSTRDVTTSATWSVEPNVIADIEAGLLTTQKIFEPQAVTITAEYTEADITAEDAKEVSIFAICPTGTALEFDGDNDYVDLGSDVYVTGEQITVSSWVNSNALGNDGRLHRIVARWAGPDNGYNNNNFLLGYDGRIPGPGGQVGGFEFAVEVHADVRKHAESGEQLMPGQWYFIVGVYDGATVKIYVDAVEKNSINESGSLNLPLEDTTKIGKENRDGHHFDGTIDEVAIYNRALSADEIRALMHTKLMGSEQGLVGCWSFDEGEGQIVYDLSPNANHGQLGSSPDIDDSDPAWVDSDAPTGICTPEGLVERNVNEALEIKLNILDEILEALAREDASVNILDDLFDEAQYGHLDKRDIIKAKQEIHSAIQGEEQAIDSLEKSAGDLEDSLEALSGDDTSPDSPPERQSKTLTKPSPSDIRKPSRK